MGGLARISAHNVDEDRDEDGACYSGTVLGVLNAANELLVVVLEGETEYGQDDDCKYRDDEAAKTLEDGVVEQDLC